MALPEFTCLQAFKIVSSHKGILEIGASIVILRVAVVMVSPGGDPIRRRSTLCLFPGVPGAGNGYRPSQVRSAHITN